MREILAHKYTTKRKRKHPMTMEFSFLGSPRMMSFPSVRKRIMGIAITGMAEMTRQVTRQDIRNLE